jgi:hypothetical protein
MSRPLKVLVVGGYGTFGGRLARLLSDVSELTLLIGGRSSERAQQFCSGVAGGAVTARLVPTVFDRGGDVEEQLRWLMPDVVVDASGPFQLYGQAPYRLVEGCLACGIDYLDLADSTEFVLGIGAFAERARERSVFVLAGVSTCPVLTSAAVRLVSKQMARVDSIHAGIAPSPHADVGLNVVRAIASYAGKPIHVRRDGRDVVAYPFTETFTHTVRVDGQRPLSPNTFSLVDVPDLQLLARGWPQCRTVWIGAAPTPAVWHKLLRGLAWLVRWRVLPSLERLAPLMYRATRLLRWGPHRGGMFVRVSGVDGSGNPITRSWNLVAEGDAGPFIPCMAAEAIIRNYVAGRVPAPGARAAMGELEIDDYAALMPERGICFDVRVE